MKTELLVVLACAFTLTACDSSDPAVGFTLVSVLPESTAGVVVQDDAVASAAMTNRICVLDTVNAEVVGDIDPGEQDEVLLDAWGDRALATDGRELFEIPRTDLDDGIRNRWRLPVLQAQLSEAGPVVLTDSDGLCGLTWTLNGANTALQIPGTDCTGTVGLTVERDTGAAWIADGNALARVTPDGGFTRWDGVSADEVVWDAHMSQVLFGQLDGGWIQAADSTGNLLWSRPVGGTLQDIEVAGNSGVSALMVDIGDNLNDIDLLDSLTGDSVGTHPLPGFADMAFSDSGTSMALVTPDEVLFYSVDTDVGMLDVATGITNTPSLSISGGEAGLLGVAGAVLGTAATVAVLAE